MFETSFRSWFSAVAGIAVSFTAVLIHGAESHPPMRLLPTASQRPAASGPGLYVNPITGNNQNQGTEAAPWKTISHALTKLQPGDTLYLRGGVYHETLTTSLRGTALAPITVRGYPGELAVIDGGIPEFFHDPSNSWEPVPDGAAHEYRSRTAFPDLPFRKDSTNLLGNFADSMIPLHGYRFLTDLRSDNHRFRQLEGPNTVQGNGLYCGPGVFLHPETKRIHIRLASTHQPAIGPENNYRGENDPRKLQLIIAGGGRSALNLDGAAHLILQDLVFRGARDASVNLENCSHITLDGVTSFGGSSALRIVGTTGLRCVDSAFRGIAAPWLWRWSLKYRSIEARIVSASSWNPPARGNRDFEFAFCEFTDCVDGVFIGNVERAEIHHCLLDNVSDDGFFITCRTAYDGSTPGGDFFFHHNRISRVLTAFAFGVGHGRQRTIDDSGNKQLGRPTVIQNNVFDLRDEVQYQEPEEGPITTFGRVAGDHGSPVWEPIDFIQNTVFSRDPPWRNYYAAGWGKAMGKGTRRRISQNIFVVETGMPGQLLPDKPVDFEARKNLHWSNELGPSGATEFLKKFRASPRFEETGWTDGDVYASPQDASGDLGAGLDVSVGVRGRWQLYGGKGSREKSNTSQLQSFRNLPPHHSSGKKIALVLGYPAFDAKMLTFAFEKAGHRVEELERIWLPATKLIEYDWVVFLGSTTRAKMEPSGFSADELETVRDYLKKGGTILVGRELTRQIFPGDQGAEFLQSLLGSAPRNRDINLKRLQPDHPWIRHLTSDAWLGGTGASPIPLSEGTNIIGDPAASRSILADIPVGRGRFIYVGWDLSRFLPSGRKPSTLADESLYESQYRIFQQIAAPAAEKR